ncbi:uncharacterized protein LOC142590315 isoform X6 [Dermacentor variabilis]|uniref:uncharacterized protein LOC142590315 isoform X6 n=1 Tax=Dermacentor variabilis TaxID=34621 RepID=UPI003F5B867F
MCIRLLATFALYAFVFASCCLAGNNSVAHEHHRYVLFNKTLPEEMTFQLQVKVPDTPIMFNLEVNATDRGLLNYTEVQPTYRIIYYNNDSMVLGNMMPTVSEKAKCSVWVKENFTLESNIPFMTNLSFQTNCKSPEYFGYLDTCGKS